MNENLAHLFQAGVHYINRGQLTIRNLSCNCNCRPRQAESSSRNLFHLTVCFGLFDWEFVCDRRGQDTQRTIRSARREKILPRRDLSRDLSYPGWHAVVGWVAWMQPIGAYHPSSISRGLPVYFCHHCVHVTQSMCSFFPWRKRTLRCPLLVVLPNANYM